MACVKSFIHSLSVKSTDTHTIDRWKGSKACVGGAE
jgi:hypothetical protein